MQTTLVSLIAVAGSLATTARTANPPASEIYEKSYPGACDAPLGERPAGHGCHAIFHKSFGPTGSFADLGQNMCWGLEEVFMEFPGPNYGCLNGNEQSAAVFADGDPPGVWEQHYALSAKELIVGAVMAIDRWGSPVYSGLYLDGAPRAVAIERIDFGSTIGRITPSLPSLCGWLGYATATDADQVDFKCALYEGARINVREVSVAYWDESGRVDATLTGAALEQAFRDYLAHYEPNGHALAKVPYVLSR